MFERVFQSPEPEGYRCRRGGLHFANHAPRHNLSHRVLRRKGVASPLSVRITEWVDGVASPPVVLRGPGPHFIGRKTTRLRGWTPTHMKHMLCAKDRHFEVGFKDPQRVGSAYVVLLAKHARHVATHAPQDGCGRDWEVLQPMREQQLSSSHAFRVGDREPGPGLRFDVELLCESSDDAAPRRWYDADAVPAPAGDVDCHAASASSLLTLARGLGGVGVSHAVVAPLPPLPPPSVCWPATLPLGIVRRTGSGGTYTSDGDFHSLSGYDVFPLCVFGAA